MFKVHGQASSLITNVFLKPNDTDDFVFKASTETARTTYNDDYQRNTKISFHKTTVTLQVASCFSHEEL